MSWKINFYSYSVPERLLFGQFLSLGMDITSIAYGDVKIRLSLLYSIALFIILLFYKTPRLAINKQILCIFAPFLIVSTVSVFVSFYPLTSLKYLAWMFFILLFTVYPILRIGINIKYEKLIQIWISSNRFVSIFLVIEFLLKISGIYENYIDDIYKYRAHLWFYEPSYAAIYLAPYFWYSIHRMKLIGYKDAIYSAFALLSLSSIIAMLALGLTIICLFRIRDIAHYIFYLIFIIILINFLINFEYLNQIEYFQNLFGYINSGEKSIIELMIDRGGIRYPMMLWGLEVGFDNPILGIGFGADQIYTSKHIPFGDIPLTGIFYEDLGGPFINIFIEIFATIGVFGLITFLYLIYALIQQCLRVKNNNIKVLMYGFLMMNMLLMVEGNFLRLYYWGNIALLIACAHSKYYREKN